MSRFSALVATAASATLLFAAAIPAQSQTLRPAQPPTQSQEQPTLSHVRIVRISEVRGAVQLDRGIGKGYEAAIINMPIVEQNRLRTEMGVAEVEFENDSTLRLGPYTEVDFSLLGRTAQGATVSDVRVVKGIAYVSLVKTKEPNQFDLAFGDRNLALQPDTHVRLEIRGEQAKLAVLGGKVQLAEADQATEVSRKHTATFALAENTQPLVAKGIESESLLDSESESRLDSWDKNLDEYHSRRASMSSFGGVPYSYGVSDMLYYGAFDNAGGCGMMWRPYFASAAWNPYDNGTWAYYSGAGYSWVSPYPWAWTPYHYGSWSFCPGTGWGWMPGGSWMGLNNIAAVSPAVMPANGIAVKRFPVAPLPPRLGQKTSLISVNHKTLVQSGVDSKGSFVFRKDSAGLGVPRHVLGNLRGFSRHADQRGMATMPIYRQELGGRPNAMRGPGNGPAQMGAQRGNAPSNRGGFSNARPAGNMGGSPGPRGMAAPMRSAPSMNSAPMAAPRASAPSGGRSH
jgi:hypothetical protein